MSVQFTRVQESAGARDGRGALAIGELYDRVWPGMAGLPDLTPVIRDLGDRFAGKVAELERAEARAARRTLIHGDASLCNTRTSPDGVIAFLDWEDVRSANGCIDLTWLLVSSVLTVGTTSYRPTVPTRPSSRRPCRTRQRKAS
jgi:Phosphotransferase enzyme family